MADGFDELFGDRRGKRGAGRGERSPAADDARDRTLLDDLREAVADLDAAGRPLSPGERQARGEEASVRLDGHGLVLGDGFYLECFGTDLGREGPAGELLPVRHRVQPADEPPLAMLWLRYEAPRPGATFA